jgi:hypothetical protein
VCSSPQLIAAYRVLHRLLEPRHPPCALSCFKKFEYCSVTRPLIEKLFVIVKKINTYLTTFSQYVKELAPRPLKGGLRGVLMLRLRISRPKVTSYFKNFPEPLKGLGSGGYRIRTDDPLRARQVL